MSLARTVGFYTWIAIVVGCRSAPSNPPTAIPVGFETSLPVAPVKSQVSDVNSAPSFAAALPPTIKQVSFDPPMPGIFQLPESRAQNLPQAELCLPDLIAEVQARNPSLQAMMAAAHAAAERFPQAVGFDDPMFNANLAPASVNSSQVETAYTLELSQKIPWFGKRSARGQVAKADANSAQADAQEVRLQLIESAESAFFEYYLVNRQRELIGWDAEVLRQFRDTAQSKYQANQVTQQDMLQADVELAQLERRQLELDRMNSVSIARLNTLLHQPPNSPLPPPPRQLADDPIPLNADEFQQLAAAQRPELASLGSQVAARQGDLELAHKQYYPDSEVYGHYDTYWQPASTQGDLRGEVGVRLNVPVYYGRLNAAVREAEDRLNQKKAEYDQKSSDIQYEVQQAYAELVESQQALKLYSVHLMPIAEQNVSAARSNYDVGKSSFLDLATAQRQLIDIREQQQAALAIYHQRIAAMERAVGSPLPSAHPVEEVLTPPSH